jgi:hypothetical protein
MTKRHWERSPPPLKNTARRLSFVKKKKSGLYYYIHPVQYDTEFTAHVDRHNGISHPATFIRMDELSILNGQTLTKPF